MPGKVGVLRMQQSGRWAVIRPDHDPVEITGGEVFRVEVNGRLRATRMEFRHHSKPAPNGEPGKYYSIDDYQLREGMRAAIGRGE
jgi:hypothetical protein